MTEQQHIEWLYSCNLAIDMWTVEFYEWLSNIEDIAIE